MHNQKVAANVRVDGRQLRERGGAVFLPYDSTYEIEVVNKRNEPIEFQLRIDGVRVSETSYTLGPNARRRVRGHPDTSRQDSAFRFIRRTEAITRHRGAGEHDGELTIEFRSLAESENERRLADFIREVRRTGAPKPGVNPTPTPSPWQPFGPQFIVGDPPPGEWSVMNQPRFASAHAGDAGEEVSGTAQNAGEGAGLTVPGKDVPPDLRPGGKRRPAQGLWVNMGVVLRGHWEDGSEVLEPLLVREKAGCPTCGHRQGSQARFCSQCGTNLNSREAQRRASA